MYVCLECRNVFEEPKLYVETHGLDSPPYEHIYGSPCCNEAYTTAYKCGNCDNWITTDSYIKIEDERYCEDCYQSYELGDEY